jgi:hypothetical protein
MNNNEDPQPDTNADSAREMSLTEYVNRLPNIHRASIEYDELLTKLDEVEDNKQLYTVLFYTAAFGCIVMGTLLLSRLYY